SIQGVSNASIFVGDVFNPRYGITAFDKEDGDLTSAIQIEGTVQTSKAGIYTLTYRVTDRNGNTASLVRTIEVKEKSTVPSNTWESSKVYLQGDQVTYNGETYTAKWWTQGEKPGSSAVWEKKIVPNPDGSVNYSPGAVYVGGNIVVYNKQTWRAKWWTQSVPGSDSSWELIK
ncbi:MAG: immunoglobulin-like domain-containing protein, partial [Bacilli bacterium]